VDEHVGVTLQGKNHNTHSSSTMSTSRWFDSSANSDNIRKPLNTFQRYKLENQFNEQVPEFSKIGKKKHDVFFASYGVGAAVGVGLGFATWKR
jgi:hypothetical protein